MTQKITHTINIGIETNARLAIATGLSQVLAETFVLYFKTHQFHWNVTGPMFNTLHTMFETQYTEMWAAIDAIAERIRSIDAFTPCNLTTLLELSTIKETQEVLDANTMVKTLVEGHETLIRNIRTLLESKELNHDEASVDLLTQRLQIHEKTAWMLRVIL